MNGVTLTRKTSAPLDYFAPILGPLPARPSMLRRSILQARAPPRAHQNGPVRSCNSSLHLYTCPFPSACSFFLRHKKNPSTWNISVSTYTTPPFAAAASWIKVLPVTLGRLFGVERGGIACAFVFECSFSLSILCGSHWSSISLSKIPSLVVCGGAHVEAGGRGARFRFRYS